MKFFSNSQPISPRQPWAHFIGMSLLLVACLFLVVPQPTADAQDNIGVNFEDANLRAAVATALGKLSTARVTMTEIKTLSTLHLGQRNITSLKGLQHATNLTKLYLSWNQISDISHLANLTKLVWLELHGNQISNISHLTGLTSLRGLTLAVNQISDISHLAELTNLSSLLDLDGNQISDISHLAELTNLNHLGLADNQISDISHLAGLTNLQALSIDGNQISDISHLAGLTNLQDLGIDGNQISDISHISGLTQLQRLSTMGTPISDHSPIHQLPHLLTYYGGNAAPNPPSFSNIAGVIIPDAGLRGAIAQAVSKAATDFISVADVQSLTRLQINGVTIQNFKGLETATNLQNLELIDNGGISDITPLAKILVNLTQLRTLGLVNNQIVNVSPLANLTQLTTLALGENQIVDVSPLARLTNLTTLALNNNQIADVSSLASLTNLITLLLHNNQIADFSPLTGLASQLRWYSNGSQVIPNPTVVIPDAELRGVIETTLNKAPGATITQEDMESLTTLQAYDAGIVDLTGLETATNLTFLSLYNNAIVDISPLANLTSLRALFLNNNQISDVSPLANLTNLAWLFLNNNQIADFSPIADVESQVQWYVKTPQVIPSPPVSIPDAVLRGVIETTLGKTAGDTITQADMETLTHLATVDASGATLTTGTILNLTGLETAINLTELHLPDHAIVDISSLATLTNLTTLYLTSNQIADVSPLASLTNLEVLGLGDNAISDVSPLASLTNLEILFLYNNRIADFSPLDGLVEQLRVYTKHAQDIDDSADAEPNLKEAAEELLEQLDPDNQGGGPDLPDLPDANPICGTAEHVPGTPCIVPAPTEAPALHLHTDINGDGIIDARDVVGIPLAPPPKRTALFANYPNPFNPETWMPYALAKPADVTVSIYAMNGHLVRKLDLGHQAAGLYRSKSRAAYWDGRNDFGERVASGVYFYVFTAGDFAATRKMLILK